MQHLSYHDVVFLPGNAVFVISPSANKPDLISRLYVVPNKGGVVVLYYEDGSDWEAVWLRKLKRTNPVERLAPALFKNKTRQNKTKKNKKIIKIKCY